MRTEIICGKCSCLMVSCLLSNDYVRYICKRCNNVVTSPNLYQIEQQTITQNGNLEK